MTIIASSASCFKNRKLASALRILFRLTQSYWYCLSYFKSWQSVSGLKNRKLAVALTILDGLTSNFWIKLLVPFVIFQEVTNLTSSATGPKKQKLAVALTRLVRWSSWLALLVASKPENWQQHSQFWLHVFFKLQKSLYNH